MSMIGFVASFYFVGVSGTPVFRFIDCFYCKAWRLPSDLTYDWFWCITYVSVCQARKLAVAKGSLSYLVIVSLCVLVSFSLDL